jgi:translocon-associated protein subunit alpha
MCWCGGAYSDVVVQPGSYDLVGQVVYEVDGKAHKNVFHNGTIDVVEAGFFVKGETIFLLTLGLGLLGLLGMWAYSKVQEFIKVQCRVGVWMGDICTDYRLFQLLVCRAVGCAVCRNGVERTMW